MATPKTLTTNECDLLIGAFAGDDANSKRGRRQFRNYTIALLMLDAGLRVGEVVKLRRHHLYFNSVPVTSIIISPEIAKNKTERTIPVSQRLSNALKIHIAYNTPVYHDWYESFAFFSQSSFHPLTTRQIERIIRAAAMKALGRPVHPHVLRHTFASRLMRVTSMRTVQELLGHKSMSSTQIYTHPNSDDLKKAIDDACLPSEEELATYHLPPRSPDVPDRPDTSGTDRDM